MQGLLSFAPRDTNKLLEGNIHRFLWIISKDYFKNCKRTNDHQYLKPMVVNELGEEKLTSM